MNLPNIKDRKAQRVIFELRQDIQNATGKARAELVHRLTEFCKGFTA